jgi:hypothetical protein
MKRIMIALAAAALIVGVIGLASLQQVSAQPGAPSVCLSLPAGEHTFTAPSQDRDGEVSFTVTVGEGGLVTGFTEPGGQSIPPVAMLEIFTGDDAYALPDGVSFIECQAGDDGMMEAGDPNDLCLNLGPGVYNESISVSGQVYDITINVGEGNRLTTVDVLGQSYAPADALALLAQFGAAIPPHIQFVPCEVGSDDSYPTGYVNAGSGGLADRSNLTGLWAGLGSLAVLVIAIAAATQRRRAPSLNRDDR